MWQNNELSRLSRTLQYLEMIGFAYPADMLGKSTEPNHCFAQSTTDKQRVNVTSTKQS